MARAADAFQNPDTGLEVGRGGFLRDAKGRPWITDPTAAVVKSGKRKGEPKRCAYGSPSGFGKTIENTYNLERWNERREALGFGLALVERDYEMVGMCAMLTHLDPDSDEFKELADRAVARAKDLAKTGLAADRGTHTHALTEDDDEGRDWIARADAGENLGIPTETQELLVEAWRSMLEREGLEVVHVEQSVVDDEWRLAGTLDRTARTTKDLGFVIHGGEVVVIPAGTVLVLDVKSGKMKLRYDGTITYWQGYAVQIASYAKSLPYDLATEQRGEWPFEIDQTHALIAHIDVAKAIETGEATCELIYVDLAAGRRAGELVRAAKAWGDERTTFSIARSEIADGVAGGGHEAAPSAPIEQGASTPTDVAYPEENVGNSSVAPLARSFATDDEERVPPHVATSGATESDPTEQFPTASPTVGSDSVPTPADQRDALTVKPDEGGMVDIVTMDALKQRYLGLSKVGRAWITALSEQAMQAKVTFHIKDNQTVRRFEILRGLTILAESDSSAEDDIVRAICASILGDVAHFPSVTVGHVLGSLDAIEAARFAARCDVLVSSDQAVGSVTDDGVLVLAFGEEVSA